MRFSCRVLAAGTLAAGLVATGTAMDGCGTADCNDTATCPIMGDDVLVRDESVIETSDEVSNMGDGLADASDAGPSTGDDAADETDGTVTSGESSAEASDATADVIVRDSAAEGPLPDAGVDMGIDVGVDTGRDAPMEAPPPKCGSNLLTPRAAVASSVLGANVAAFAIDGNFGTRWESTHGVDPEWIYLDSGSPVSFNRVRIIWELACAANYDIQSSNDSTTWTTMTSVAGNMLGSFMVQTDWSNAVNHTGFTGVGRYLRIFGTVRCFAGNINYGYSIWEMQAYGDTNTTCH